jgi:hypothetical protein
MFAKESFVSIWPMEQSIDLSLMLLSLLQVDSEELIRVVLLLILVLVMVEVWSQD